MAKANGSQKKKTTNSTKKATTKSTKKVAPTKKATKTSANKTATVKKVEKVEVEKEIIKPEPAVKVEKAEIKSAKKTKKENIISKVKTTILKNWEEKREFSIACIIIFVLAIIIVVLAFSKRIPKTKNGEEILASIDGLTITSDKLYSNLKDSYGTNQVINMIDEAIADDYVKELTKENEKYIDQVVDYYKQYADYYGVSFEEFLSQYVGISGVTTEDEFRDYVTKDYKKTLAVKKYIGSTISEEELKKEFKENYKEKLTVRHILIEVNDDTSEEDAKAKAEELIKQLNEVKDDTDKLEKKFKDLAYDNSDDTATYEDGGLYKDFSKGEVDESFYKAAKDLKKGEYTAEPVKSQYGYHIIFKVSSKTNKYEDVKDKIKDDLAEKKLNEDTTLQVSAWDKLRKKYNLKINDTDVKKAYNKTIKDSTSKADTDKSKSDTSNSESDSNSDSSEEKKEDLNN